MFIPVMMRRRIHFFGDEIEEIESFDKNCCSGKEMQN
jgi:transcription-repair coupling factor (superfamily II helicase)